MIGVLLLSAAIVYGQGEKRSEKKQSTSFLYVAKRIGIPFIKAAIKMQEGSFETGKPAYQLRARVYSLNTGLLFRMDNQFTSIVETEGFTPVRYIRSIDQGGLFVKRKDYVQTVTFDSARKRMMIEQEGEEKKEIPLPPHVYDPLSMFARYVLKEELRPGQDIHMSIYDGVNVREMVFHTKEERVRSELLGEIEAVVLESTTSFSSFGDREGQIRIWYKADQRIPISMELDLPVGSIRFELESIEKG